MNIQKIRTPAIPTKQLSVRLIALPGIPLIQPQDDLAAIILAGLGASGEKLSNGDVVVIAQKIVSKSEGRIVKLGTVSPSDRAQEIARTVNKDPRLVELILRESTEVIRQRRDVLIVAHRLGLIMANAGIDLSNVQHDAVNDTALLLPEDPDRTCAQLRQKLRELTGVEVAVLISDSHGRAFRNGIVGVAIGASGLPALTDRRGEPDLYGRQLQSTEVALADEIASAASLLMGQADEGRPIVIARGVPMHRRDGSAADLIRPQHIDLFRAPSGETMLRSRRSIRRYLPKVVPPTILQTILETATCAPSAHNRQPWRFAIIEDAGTKERLADAMGARLRADRSRDGDALDKIEKDVARSFTRIVSAPTLVLTCMTMEDMDRYPDAQRSAAERLMAVQGTAMAIQTLLLAAHAAGLGASVMCAPLFCPDIVRSALDLPPDWEPQALVTLGFPADSGKPLRRQALGHVVRKIRAKS
jgi:coenzyme F420-0:L-glutamate ligase/coenzyme F420-1:gamma-L-glutamate ligase